MNQLTNQPTSQLANQPTSQPITKPFLTKLASAQARNNSWVCVGLDVTMAKMPLPMLKFDDPVFPFARAIVDATKDVACAFKPNLGFFLAEGAAGIIALERIVRYIPNDIPIILDAKFADIGNTAEQYARAAFEAFKADAVTVYPGACGLVVGATAPEALARMRAIAPDLPFLIPGIGAQGGDLAATVEHGPTQSGLGPIINASRSILYASSGADFAEAARAAALKLRDEINAMRG